jgi:hypothetical protein
MNIYQHAGCIVSLFIINCCGLYCQDKKPLFDSLLAKDFGEQCSIVRNKPFSPYPNSRGVLSSYELTIISKQNDVYVQFYEFPISNIDTHFIEEQYRNAERLSCMTAVLNNENFKNFVCGNYHYLVVPSCDTECDIVYSWCYTFKLEFMEFLKRNNLSIIKY